MKQLNKGDWLALIVLVLTVLVIIILLGMI